MDLDELERIAMRGGPMPKNLTPPNQVYFQGLAYLYARFRAGFIDRECGSVEKGEMLYQRDLSERKEAFSGRLIKHHAEQTRAVEAAQIAYQKNRTLENADRLSAVLDGRLTECNPAGPVQNT